MHIEWLLISGDEKIESNEAIEADKPSSEIRQEPYSLPGGFHWDTLDINDPMVVSSRFSCFLQRIEMSFCLPMALWISQIPIFQSSRKLFQVCRTICRANLQCSAKHFDPLLDIFLSWWPANMSSNSCLPCRTCSCIEPCRTKCPAMLEPSAGHQQKCTGHVWHVRHILRSLMFVPKIKF